MATDAVTYRWKIDGTLVETTPGLSVELDGLSAGAHTLTVTAVDDSGNESGAATFNFTVPAAGATVAGRRSMLGVGT
jgi:hypothetical protein